MTWSAPPNTPVSLAGPSTPATPGSPGVLLEVEHLDITLAGCPPRAITRDISFAIEGGRTLGVVGESGSGKSMTMLAIIGLLPKDIAVSGGSIRLSGRDLCAMSEQERRGTRGSLIAMVFQDPMTSLNPVLTIGTQIRESLRPMNLRGRAARERAAELLNQVGLADPLGCLGRHPHQLSGGMRQRVMLAMALAAEPRLLIADEPTTALDVTTQAQIRELVSMLQAEHGFACIWVSHDLGVIAGVADDVMVMYAGRGVEMGPAPALFHFPSHPYTRGLLGSITRLDQPRPSRLNAIAGHPPSPYDPPPGCPFSPRCAEAEPACDTAVPALFPVGTDHSAACLHAAPTADGRQRPLAGQDLRAPA